MRLILVKPTNATRRLDSTGEVFHEADDERYNSGGPSPPPKTTEGVCDRYSGTSVQVSPSPHESSLCCVSSVPRGKSNGVSSHMPPLKTSSLTFSQLNDQDWLLLCGQVGRMENDTTPADIPRTSLTQSNQIDRCDCSCLDANSQNSNFQLHLKQAPMHDCFCRVSNKPELSNSQHSHSFPPSAKTLGTLSQSTTEQHFLKPGVYRVQDNFVPQCSSQESCKELSPCSHFKSKDPSPPPSTDLFNIPVTTTVCADKSMCQNQPAEHSWRDLFGTEPLLVQQCQKQDSHCFVRGEQTCNSSEDPSIIAKCHHIQSNMPREKRSSSPAINKSIQSLSTSQYSSLKNQGLVVEREQQRQTQVKIALHCICGAHSF